MSEVLENLKTAKALLVSLGVGHGSLYGRGQYCSLGAVAAAKTGIRGNEVNDLVGSEGDPYEAEWPELEALREFIPERWASDARSLGVSVYRYNDHGDLGEGRQAHVLAMFDQAIEKLEQEL